MTADFDNSTRNAPHLPADAQPLPAQAARPDEQPRPEAHQQVRVRRLATVDDTQLHQLAQLLIDCVDGGASVSFMHPLAPDRALDFWRGVAAGLPGGGRALLVAEDEGGIIGTVQLVLAQPDNQPHRADVSKMLVLRRARRRGVGDALMRVAERVARECGKTLLVLDTASGDAERLYRRLGWRHAGVVPDYALLPDGALCDTAFYYRKLDAAPANRALDNPVWHALAEGHDAMAQCHGLAARYPRDVSPLAGLREPSRRALDDLRAMVDVGEDVWLLTPHPLDLPPGWEAVRLRYIDQMVYTGAPPAAGHAVSDQAGSGGAAADHAGTGHAAAGRPASASVADHASPLLALGADDVPDMIALAAETKPGPFVHKTITMGGYLGVRADDGSLAAMSGTRMALAGHTEISAVCTSPKARGAGHARALMLALIARIAGSGKTPFLHVKTENGAKQVYEKLGFAVRREICFSVLRRVA